MDIVIDRIELRVPSKAEYVSIVRAFVTDLSRRLGLCTSSVEDVQVAVSEACTNVVLHAYSDADHGSELVVRCGVKNGRLTVEIADSGQGFANAVGKPKYSRDRDGGFGLVLIRNLMENVSLDSSPDQGTVVRMSKQTDRSGIRRSQVRSSL